MNVSPTRSGCYNKVLFVWDGTPAVVSAADHWLLANPALEVIAVHAIPHQSIYSFGTLLDDGDNLVSTTRNLVHRYYSTIKQTSLLKNAKFELLIGDRITEISRYAFRINADAVMLPAFQQSGFSKWIHGDLNQRILNLVSCPVFFLEAHCSADNGSANKSSVTPRQQSTKRRPVVE